MNTRIVGMITVFITLFFTFPVIATEGGFGVKLGMYFPDGMTVEGGSSRDFDTDSGLTFGLFTNIKLGSNGYFSPFVDYTSFQNGADDVITLIDIGGDFKIRSGDGNVKPGAGLAYGIGDLETDPAIGFVTEESNSFLVYKLFVEMDFDKLIGELGFRGYTGGNEEDVYINPGLYLRVGFMF